MNDEGLIRAVEQRPALYSRSDPCYSNREAVRALWAECAAEVNMDVEAVKKRWSYLRDYFLKLRRGRKHSLSKSSKKKWPLFNSLNFLVPHLHPHPQLQPPDVDSASDEEGGVDDEVLIGAVERRPGLYSRSDPHYSSREAFRTLWAECAAEIDMDVLAARKRWSYLRDYFLKQYRARRQGTSKPSRKWPLYDRMTFLVPHLQPDGGTASDGGSQAKPQDAPTVAHTQPSSTSHPDRLRIPQTESQPKRPRVMMPSPSTSEVAPPVSRCGPDMDDHEHFFQSLLPAMRRLDPVAAMEFRIEVQCLLLRYVKQAAAPAAPSPPLLANDATIYMDDMIKNETEA